MNLHDEHRLEDDLGRDMLLARALSELDPATGDPAYWPRFRGWVGTAAGAELARRRLMAKLTVQDVMSSWARAVLPTAMLAAALAGLILMRSHSVETPLPLGVEELLLTDLQGLSIPAMLAPEAGASISFASEVF